MTVRLFEALAWSIIAAPLPDVDETAPEAIVDGPDARDAGPDDTNPEEASGDEPIDVTYGTTRVLEEETSSTPQTEAPTQKPPPHPAAIRRDSSVDLSARKRRSILWKPEGQSPQRFAIELKFGPYVPEVDRGWDGPGLGPYATVFGRTNDHGQATGQPRPGLVSAVSFEWQFFYLAGPISIGLQAAFFRDKADALIAEPVAAGESLRSDADRVTFSVLPLSALLGYRFEMLADRWRVPIVPYFRGGLAYGFWWARDGSGKIARNMEGVKGRGGTLGWQINAGGMLRLDWIERGTAKKLDQQTGINHTYLFAEYQLARIDGFGSSAAMSVGDSTFFIGLAAEF